MKNLSATELTDHSLWKATKRIKRPQKFIPPIKFENGTWARRDKEKACAFAEHLSRVFQPHQREISEQQEIQLLKESEECLMDNTPITNTTLKEDKNIIRNIKHKKSPGYDGINGKLLKERPRKAIRYLAILINVVFRLQHYPDQWKVAQIILIVKPAKVPEYVTSYRSVSLLPILSKVSEKILLKD